jgi:hypothetical protein
MSVPDEVLTELYGAELDDFVRVRNEFARRLTSDGRKTEAGAVKALRKPSLAAWTVNRVARDFPGDVTRLLGAGDELREAISNGDAVRMQRASRARRDAVSRLVDRARSVLTEGGRSSPGQLDRVARTFYVAATEEEARDLVRHGVLVRELESAGLDDAFALAPAFAEPVEDVEADVRAEELARAEKLDHEAIELEDTARRLDREARKAEAEARRARAAADKAARDAERARAKADTAASK